MLREISMTDMLLALRHVLMFVRCTSIKYGLCFNLDRTLWGTTLKVLQVQNQFAREEKDEIAKVSSSEDGYRMSI